MGKAGLWFKRLWKRLRSFRFTKKRVLLVSAVLAAAALGFGVWRFLRPAGGALPAMADAVRTTRLEKTTLSESITVTGTVESGSVANVTTSLSYPVKEIFVQVGDTVSEGDVICTLDSSDLEEQLAKRQEALAESRETAQKNYDKAVESYNSAAAKQTEAYNAYASAASALETARNTEYLNAANSVSSYQSAYDAALTAEQEAGAALNNANTALSAAQAGCDAAQAALDADSANPELQAARDNAAAALTAAQNTAAAAQSDYTAKSAARQAAEDALKTAKANSGYDALYQAYAAADQAWLQARSTYETATETLRQAKENMETAAENLENAGTSDEIEELEEQIADCTITAGASGTITTLNATVGSAAGGGTSNTALAVIQNTDDLKVSITIDEDDIKSVAVGQQAIIKSDATGDTEIAGTVSQLSLTSGSTGSTQGGTGSSGFGAEVTVTGKDSGLLIGLSAKVEIILSQVTDVYAVPYDAVGTDENGGSVVYARSGGETEFTAIPVETGMETDYYIEISGEGLSDGMEVKTSANDTATAAAGADDAQQSGENAMFSMDMGGGMPGGDMPGGGGGGMPSGGPGGEELEVLHGIDLTVRKGEFVAIVGASGSGKSTLMNIIGALDRPTEGTYVLDGVDVGTLRDKQLSRIRCRKIGFVFQTFNLVPRTSALKNVALPMMYNGVRGTARTQRARALLDMVEMGDRAGHAPSQLSGGQKQRVAIARAMANDPAILLADEPTGALDSATGRLVMDLFHRLHREQGKTIVLITHSPELAGECQRIVTIKDGRVTGVRRGGGAADAAV